MYRFQSFRFFCTKNFFEFCFIFHVNQKFSPKTFPGEPCHLPPCHSVQISSNNAIAFFYRFPVFFTSRIPLCFSSFFMSTKSSPQRLSQGSLATCHLATQFRSVQMIQVCFSIVFLYVFGIVFSIDFEWFF